MALYLYIKRCEQRQELLSVFQDLEITGDNDVFKNGTVWNIDSLAIWANNDDGTFQLDAFAKKDITCNSQMVEFDDFRHMGDSLLEVGNFFEMRAQFDQGSTTESCRIHD